MAKQSNEFQRKVLKIERLLKDEGFEITESKYLSEKGLNNIRETDVHLVGKISNGRFPVHVAIEAREHHKVQDITWIDSLIGKYTNLKPIIIVAVSDVGFSEPAMKKAESEGIKCIILEHIDETEWRQLVKNVYLKFIKVDVILTGASVETKEKIDIDGYSLGGAIIREGDNPKINFTQKAHQLFNSDALHRAMQYVAENAKTLYQTSENKEFPLFAQYGCVNTYLEVNEGVVTEIFKITCEIKVKISFLDPNSSQFIKYDDLPIQIGSYKDEKNNIEHTVTIAVAEDGEKNAFKIMTESGPISSKKLVSNAMSKRKKSK